VDHGRAELRRRFGVRHAAMQPSIEDIILGAFPASPRSTFIIRCWPTRSGRVHELLVRGRRDRLGAPFVLIVEGSIPNEEIKSEGYWAALGTDKKTGQPITTCEWIDRLAPKAVAVVGPAPAPPTAASTPWPATRRLHGLADYLGWDWRSKAGIPIVNVPGCPVQPDNMTETLLYLLYQVAGWPHDTAGQGAATDLAVRQDRPRGCDRGGYYEQADFAHEYGSPNVW